MPEQNAPPAHPERSFREHLRRIIFEADTPAGKAFDIALLWAIALSVIAVMLESVEAINARYGTYLRDAEWFFTILFTIEYIVRIAVVRKPRNYIFSFFGIIDLLACIPTYLTLFVTGTQALAVIRIVRILRVFRVLKMVRHLGEANVILNALLASRAKITVFLLGVLSIAVIMGSIVYMFENPVEGTTFTSIPRALYWAIVTLTTVGYGDISPTTVPGQCIAVLVMILGYAIIAVPTGIVSVEIQNEAARQRLLSSRCCPHCTAEGHRPSAKFCYNCGGQLEAADHHPDFHRPPPQDPIPLGPRLKRRAIFPRLRAVAETHPLVLLAGDLRVERRELEFTKPAVQTMPPRRRAVQTMPPRRRNPLPLPARFTIRVKG